MVSLRRWASMIEHVHAASPAADLLEREGGDPHEPALGEWVAREVRHLLLADGEATCGGSGGQG